MEYILFVTDETCHFGGTCIDGEDNFTCTCMPGYTGLLCENKIDVCESNNCVTPGNSISLSFVSSLLTFDEYYIDDNECVVSVSR